MVLRKVAAIAAVFVVFLGSVLLPSVKASAVVCPPTDGNGYADYELIYTPMMNLDIFGFSPDGELMTERPKYCSVPIPFQEIFHMSGEQISQITAKRITYRDAGGKWVNGPATFTFRAEPGIPSDESCISRITISNDTFSSNGYYYALISSGRVVADLDYWNFFCREFQFVVPAKGSYEVVCGFTLVYPITDSVTGVTEFVKREVFGTHQGVNDTKSNANVPVLHPAMWEGWSPGMLTGLEVFYIDDFWVTLSSIATNASSTGAVEFYLPYVSHFGRPDVAIYPVVVEKIVDTPLEWIYNSVDRFLAIEFLPGLSIGFIVSAFLTVMVAIALLRLWGGG